MIHGEDVIATGTCNKSFKDEMEGKNIPRPYAKEVGSSDLQKKVKRRTAHFPE